MRTKLSSKFVSKWLFGTALFVMAFALWNAWSTYNPVWGIVGWMGGMIMFELHAETEGRRIIDPSVFFVILLTLIVIAVNMALASLGLCEDVFGLLK